MQISTSKKMINARKRTLLERESGPHVTFAALPSIKRIKPGSGLIYSERMKEFTFAIISSAVGFVFAGRENLSVLHVLSIFLATVRCLTPANEELSLKFTRRLPTVLMRD